MPLLRVEGRSAGVPGSGKEMSGGPEEPGVGIGGRAVSSAPGLVNSFQLCSQDLCVLVWAGRVPHTCAKHGSKPALLACGVYRKGQVSEGEQRGCHFSHLSGQGIEVRVRVVVSGVDAVSGLGGPRDLGPHTQVWFFRFSGGPLHLGDNSVFWP